MSMSCEPGGSCKLKLSGLGLDSIAAQCDVGECLQPTQGTLGNETREWERQLGLGAGGHACCAARTVLPRAGSTGAKVSRF